MVKTIGQDKRVVNTRIAARDAMIALINEKGVGNFTVTELCQRAELNRGTFYNHWKSIDDALLFFEDELIADMEHCARNFPKLDRNLLKQGIDEGKPLSGIVHVFECLKKQSALLMAVSSHNGDGRFVLRMRTALSQVFLEHIVNDRFDCSSETDAEYFAWYHASAFLGALQCWLLRGCKESTEEVSLKLMSLLYCYPSKMV